VARTLIAWIRTAVSLVTFGLTIYKAFQYLREHGFGSEADSILGPRARPADDQYGIVSAVTAEPRSAGSKDN
jgi:hypothetical protein